MQKKHLWELSPEEAEKYVDDFIASKSKLEIVSDLLDLGASLEDINRDLLQEAIQEMLAQITEESDASVFSDQELATGERGSFNLRAA